MELKTTLLPIILLLALASAADYGQWQYSSANYGAGTAVMTPSVLFDNDVIFKTESTTASRGVWKLYTTIPYPGTGAFEVSFKAKVDAPGIYMSRGRTFSSGADDGVNNDGPNMFSFIYAGDSLTPESPGMQPKSYSWWNYPPSTSSLCHVNRQCNYFGPTDGIFDDCDSATNTITQGWVFDANTISNFGRVSITNAPAFRNNEWKEIVMNIYEDDCADANKTNYEYITIVISGTDFTSSYPFVWWVKDVRIAYAGTDERVPLDYVYNFNEGGAEMKVPNYCGDGEKAGSEECDGQDGVIPGWRCTANCLLETVCGDGVIAGNEVCDGLQVTPGFECSRDCMSETPICGDNKVVAGELCDGSQVTQGFLCSADCQSMAPVCGDGIVVGNEECDGMNGTDATHLCAPDCTLYRRLSDPEMLLSETVIDQMSASAIGKPSLEDVALRGPASITLKDLLDQVKVRELNMFAGRGMAFCTTPEPPCEEKYVLEDEMLLASDTIFVKDDSMSGLMKVYISPLNGTDTYFIGFRPNPPGFFDFLGKIDSTTWVVVGVAVALIFVAAIVLVFVMGGFVYLKKFGKKKGRM